MDKLWGLFLTNCLIASFLLTFYLLHVMFSCWVYQHTKSHRILYFRPRNIFHVRSWMVWMIIYYINGIQFLLFSYKENLEPHLISIFKYEIFWIICKWKIIREWYDFLMKNIFFYVFWKCAFYLNELIILSYLTL